MMSIYEYAQKQTDRQKQAAGMLRAYAQHDRNEFTRDTEAALAEILDAVADLCSPGGEGEPCGEWFGHALHPRTNPVVRIYLACESVVGRVMPKSVEDDS